MKIVHASMAMGMTISDCRPCSDDQGQNGSFVVSHLTSTRTACSSTVTTNRRRVIVGVSCPTQYRRHPGQVLDAPCHFVLILDRCPSETCPVSSLARDVQEDTMGEFLRFETLLLAPNESFLGAMLSETLGIAGTHQSNLYLNHSALCVLCLLCLLCVLWLLWLLCVLCVLCACCVCCG